VARCTRTNETAIDANILSAIWKREKNAVALTDQLSELRRCGSLIICGAVLAEAMANPNAGPGFVDDFLHQTGIKLDGLCREEMWRLAGERYAQYAARRRQSQREFVRRLLTDFIIGAHAVLEADQLMTLDRGRYERDFPELKLV
jgi:predicted nucleic acid-binding protein